jgi:hypothetical protein
MNTVLANESDFSPAPAMATAVAPSSLTVKAMGLPRSGVVPVLLDRLLAMARKYRADGNDRQATELFWTLTEDNPETPQGEAAKLELMAMAEDYGRLNSQHIARSIFERLLSLED